MKKYFIFLMDPQYSTSQKLFLVAEMICFPLSLLTFIYLLLQLGFRFAGVEISLIPDMGMKVLLAAAVGYLTNWIAIEMLFRPYDPHPWLFFWPQGLVPRNKKKIGLKTAEKVTTELLTPEKLTEQIMRIFSEQLQSDSFKENLLGNLQGFLIRYEDTILEKAVPQIENALKGILQTQLSQDRLMDLWDRMIVPWLEKEENKQLIARKITSGLQEHTPEMILEIKIWLRQYVDEFARQHLPGMLADLFNSFDIPQRLIRFIDWNLAERKLKEKLSSRSLQDNIKNIFLQWIRELKDWGRALENQRAMNSFLDQMHNGIHDLMRNYIQNHLPGQIHQLLHSEKLWQWVEEQLLPGIKPQLEQFLREKTPELLEKIDIQGMIAEAVDHQDIRKFHQMINDVAMEHLGAIQVLGFFLGALAGTLLLFCE